MSAVRDEAQTWDIAHLERAGFSGFHTVRHLAQTGCLDVPVERGVYAVVRDSEAKPEFMPRSTAGRFRGQDPTVNVDVLTSRWVEGTRVIYIGRASGPGVRSLLQQRVKRMIRFGLGKVVGHWDGRYVWQLCDHMTLQVAWLLTEDPAATEAALLRDFERLHGRLPFANLREEQPE